MTTSTYRCAGCRLYQPRPEYRRIGLGAVCSPECFTLSQQRRSRRPTARNPMPPDIYSQVRTRDRERCRYCGTTENLHVHHIEYRSEGGAHEAGNLITLCLEHHDLVHGDKGRWQPVCAAYITNLASGNPERWLIPIDRALRRRPA